MKYCKQNTADYLIKYCEQILALTLSPVMNAR